MPKSKIENKKGCIAIRTGPTTEPTTTDEEERKRLQGLKALNGGIQVSRYIYI